MGDAFQKLFEKFDPSINMALMYGGYFKLNCTIDKKKFLKILLLHLGLRVYYLLENLSKGYLISGKFESKLSIDGNSSIS